MAKGCGFPVFERMSVALSFLLDQDGHAESSYPDNSVLHNLSDETRSSSRNRSVILREFGTRGRSPAMGTILGKISKQANRLVARHETGHRRVAHPLASLGFGG